MRRSGYGARGSCHHSVTSALGDSSCVARAAPVANWGCRCLSTPSEPVPFRLSRPCRTARRILCVVCRRQWSKLGLEGSEGTFGRSEDIEMLIATGTSRGTAGISECPPFLTNSSFSFVFLCMRKGACLLHRCVGGGKCLRMATRVLVEQADFRDVTDMEALTAENRWLLPPLCFLQLHRQLACDPPYSRYGVRRCL